MQNPILHNEKKKRYHRKSLVWHIFGEQYDLGLDYLQILYTMPLQKLPILLLVSEERNTGKSTFFNFLKLLFEANITFNTNKNFRSQSNDDWNGKLVIVVDEVLLNKCEDSERMKNLSTTRNYKMEAKGHDREEVSFFAKFVLCSNNEYLPVVIDPGETRYWVRKIPKLTADDTTFLEKIRYEIPVFLHALTYRQLSTAEESRMWFDPKLIDTDALQKIIRANRNRVELELAELLLDIMASMQVDPVYFCFNDILNLFDYHSVINGALNHNVVHTLVEGLVGNFLCRGRISSPLPRLRRVSVSPPRLVLCRLHAPNLNRLVSGSREQARHKPTVGFGGINDKNFVHVCC